MYPGEIVHEIVGKIKFNQKSEQESLFIIKISDHLLYQINKSIIKVLFVGDMNL